MFDTFTNNDEGTPPQEKQPVPPNVITSQPVMPASRRDQQKESSGRLSPAASQPSIQSAAAAGAPSRANDRDALVLVVEDNPDMNEYIRSLLVEDGYWVAGAYDGRQGLFQMENTHPDIVISDVVMPLLSGDRMLREMRAREEFRDTPVLLLTGRADSHLKVNLLREGANDYIEKPFSVEELLVRVHNLVEMRRTRQALLERNTQLGEALTELRRTQRDIIQQERLRALGQMASGVVHQFNNILTPILAYSEVLRENTSGNDSSRQAADIIHESVLDARKMVGRLRDFYRESPTAEVYEPVNVNKVIREAVLMAQPRWSNQAQSRGISIDVREELGEVSLVAGNATDLRSALLNVIFNSVDALPRGGAIILRSSLQRGNVVIEVADTGMGMTEEVLQRSMEPYFSTKGANGTGLGLALVYGIVTRHKGSIQITSIPGEGTVVRLVFSPLDSGKGKKMAEPPRAGASRTLHILLVDDDQVIHHATSAFLTRDGHTVTTASSGMEGLERFREKPYDLVVTDWAMPEMSGDQMALAIKKLSPQTPIIMLTGFADTGAVPSKQSSGVDLVLGKPFTLAELRNAIAKVAAIRK